MPDVPQLVKRMLALKPQDLALRNATLSALNLGLLNVSCLFFHKTVLSPVINEKIVFR